MKQVKNLAYLLPAAALLLLAPALSPTRAQEANQAGLVIQFGEGRTETRCVEFSEGQISGYEVLLRAGLEVVVVGDIGMGSVVCSIDGEGCPADDCWCQCKTMGSDCTYWSYWNLDGDWVYSQLGMGGHYVSHGDVEGWSWGKTEPPMAITFEEICVPPATDTPTPTVTSTPTLTPSVMPTDTPAPTATWTPSPTLEPPTATPPPTDTPQPTATLTQEPVSSPTTEALMLAATTPRASPAATRGEAPAQGGKAPPTDTPLPATDVPSSTPTPAVQNMDTATPESSQTPTPAATPQPPTETPTLETVVPPTGTPVVVALATFSTGETEDNSSQSGGGGESGGRANRLLAILSIGAGVAYLFFGLFVVALAAIYVVVGRR